MRNLATVFQPQLSITLIYDLHYAHCLSFAFLFKHVLIFLALYTPFFLSFFGFTLLNFISEECKKQSTTSCLTFRCCHTLLTLIKANYFLYFLKLHFSWFLCNLFVLYLCSLQPASGTPITGKGVVICKYPSDPSIALGYLSLVFLIGTTVAGFLSLFYPYKGKSVPQGAMFRSTSFVVFLNIAM